MGDEPWGFAPFHYGRWVYYRDSWGWVPGRRVDRPVYAPALVAWMGTPGNGAAVRGGSQPAVGWFPLAPREPYVPAYRASEQHIHQLNTAHIARNVDLSAITRNPQAFIERTHYAHRDLPQAVTVVPGEALGRRRPVAESIIPRTAFGDAGRSPSVLLRPSVEHSRYEGEQRTGEGGRRPDDRGFGRQPVSPSVVPGARNPFAAPAVAVPSVSAENAAAQTLPGSSSRNRESGAPSAGRYAPEAASTVGRPAGARPPIAPRDAEPALSVSERVEQSRTPDSRPWPPRPGNSSESRGSASAVPTPAIREPSETPRPPASISGTPGTAPFSQRPPVEAVAPTRVERSTAERLPPPATSAARQERTEASGRDNNVRREEPAARPFRREPPPAPAANVPAPRGSAPAPRSEAPPPERPSRPERPRDAARLFEHRAE